MFASLRPWAALRPFGSLGSSPAPPAPVPRTLRQAIYSRLVTDPDVVALVEDRIHPVGLPQGCEKPALTYYQAGGFEPRTFDGATAYRSARFRISCWASSEDDAEDLVAVVRDRLVDFRGVIGTVRISSIGVENELDVGGAPTAGTDDYSYQVVLELRIWHRTS